MSQYETGLRGRDRDRGGHSGLPGQPPQRSGGLVRERVQALRAAAGRRRADPRPARRARPSPCSGPNGAGKSTTLDMLLGLKPARRRRGQVFGDAPGPRGAGRPGRRHAAERRPDARGHGARAGRAGLRAAPAPRPGRTRSLERAGITEIADQQVNKLSGGQDQRVRFALATAGDTDLIVLDEPTAAMDVAARQAFWATMREQAGQGRTVLFATHYLEEADAIADRSWSCTGAGCSPTARAAEIKARAGAGGSPSAWTRWTSPSCSALPGLVNLEVRHDVVRIQSSDSDATLYAILDAGYRPSEIEVASLGLEQAFLAITAEDDADQRNHARRGDELTWPAHWPSPRPNSAGSCTTSGTSSSPWPSR